MTAILHQKLTLLPALCIISATFIIRAALFMFYISPNNYHHQPDSYDYHVGAICIATGNGMFRPDIKQPIFWRTPGYSYFLHFFYKAYGFFNTTFEGATKAQQAAIWCQIVLNAFIPLILYALAYLLTQSYCVAWIVAGISAVHPGFVLASDYLLSEGPSLLFFYIFLCVLFTVILKKDFSWLCIVLMVLSLAIYTWMRPAGQWIGVISACIIVLCSAMSFKKRVRTAVLFIILFLSSLAPWCIRNYHYTHELFFNPTLGPYLTCFSVPKILRRLYNIPLDQAVKVSQRNAAYEVEKRRKMIESQGLFSSQEACKKYAVPVIMNYPYYFIYDWITECIKTTFDLYSYQLVSLATNTYSWDPLEEYLPEKLAQTLWKSEIPLASRIIGWVELLLMLCIWVGLLRGLWMFLIKPCVQRKRFSDDARIWITALLLCGATIGMTGGFGYARLRLPIEPLLIILGLVVILQWFYPRMVKERPL